jgi:outer membrane protein assembly factor BamD (BamD/ComL family)
MLPKVVWTILGLLMLAGAAVFVGWVMVRALKRSDDPPKLVVRWVVTLLVGGVLVFILGGFGPSVGGAFAVPFVCVFLGIVLSVTWAPSLAAILARPLTSLFDGGLEEGKLEPLYSTAQARRKRGQVHEALWEIQRQLDQFPNDLTGQLLMADIQANDLKDLQAAQATIARLCEQPNHPPPAIADALSQLAEWHVKIAQDTESARQALQEILQRFPDSAWSHAASQRLAHLGSAEQLLAPHGRQPVVLPHVEAVFDPRRAGSLPGSEESAPDEAQRLVQHLEAYPDDNEVRERLATLYALHYQRLDLAAGELEQLIAQPNAPPRRIAHWLNLLADWQLELAKDAELAHQSLQRIIDRFPDQAPAELARQRMEHLQRQLKKGEQAKVVKLGSYEQNLGLKWGRPPTGGRGP